MYSPQSYLKNPTVRFPVDNKILSQTSSKFYPPYILNIIFINNVLLTQIHLTMQR